MANVSNKKTNKIAAAKPVARKTVAAQVAAPAVKVDRVAALPVIAPAVVEAPIVAAAPVVAEAVAAVAPAQAIPVIAVIAEPVVTQSIPTQPTPAAKIAAPEKGMKIMNDTVKQVEANVKKATAETTEKATAMFQDVSNRAKAAFEKSGEMAKDVVEFNKANLEAVVEAGKIAVKGAQTAAQRTADVARKNFEATTSHLKAVGGIKTPTDFFKMQGDFARTQFDGAVAEVSKSSEFYLKLAGEIMQPIQNRYTVAAEQVKARMAA